jgi:hypothetical protein
MELEMRLAQRRVGTRAELEGLLADEFREFGCSGREYTRQEVLGAWEFGHPLECEVTDYRVLAVGADAVLATYRTAQPGGRLAQRSSLWCKRSGCWKLIFHQGTLAP